MEGFGQGSGGASVFSGDIGGDSHWQAPYFRCRRSANGIETQTETEIEVAPEGGDDTNTQKKMVV